MQDPQRDDYADPAEQGDMALRDLMLMLRRRIWVIVGSVAVILALTALALFAVTPRYTAQALVKLETREQQVVDVEDVMAGLPAETAAIATEISVIESRSFARRVVEELNLTEDPEFNGRLREPSLVRRLLSLDWLTGDDADDAPVETPEETEARAMRSAVGSLLGAIDARRQGPTYVIAVSAESVDPQKAALIANSVADLYIVEQLEGRFEATRRANEWLSDRLSSLRQQVQAAEEAVEIYRAENDLVDASGQTLTDQQISELNGKLILARAEYAEKQARYQRFRELTRSNAGVDTLAEALQSNVVSDLRLQLAQLDRRIADLASRYGDRHPEMIKARAERRDLAAAVSQEVDRTLASLENEVVVSRSRVESLRASLEELTGGAGRGVAEVRLRELEREAEAVRSLYESFLKRFQETSEQQTLNEAQARVISEATVPGGPSFPNVPLTLGIMAVFSLMVGGALAYLTEQLDNAFRTGSQIESFTGAPHLASVPLLDKSDAGDPIDYLLNRPLSVYSEAVRAVRSALALYNVDRPSKLIQVTSALPDEGKTTLALSLARLSAAAGDRVALVDCDLRHPTVARRLGLAPEIGAAEYLAGRCGIEEVRHTDTKGNVDVYPMVAKQTPANPSDLLGSSQMRNFLAELNSKYDVVVLDSAPLIPVVDSQVLATRVDAVVMVVRWQWTTRDAVSQAMATLRQRKAPVAGVALSQVDLRKQRRLGYGDSTYYYGRYSRYYSN